MCLILFAIDARDDARLVLAANRDEEHARPTAPAAFWSDAPDMFGGRDLRAGGTWLGVTRAGRLAALTNVRSPGARRVGRSRGALVKAVLEARGEIADDVARVVDGSAEYPSFNLVASDSTATLFATDEGTTLVEAGVHGLSNDRLDSPWPKVVRGRERMGRILARPGAIDREALFAALADRGQAPDTDLPVTGVPLEIERALSAAFIVSPIYGTRCSTVVVVGRDGSVDFEERSFSAVGSETGRVHRTWTGG